jgi:hypothetical protein
MLARVGPRVENRNGTPEPSVRARQWCVATERVTFFPVQRSLLHCDFVAIVATSFPCQSRGCNTRLGGSVSPGEEGHSCRFAMNVIGCYANRIRQLVDIEITAPQAVTAFTDRYRPDVVKWQCGSLLPPKSRCIPRRSTVSGEAEHGMFFGRPKGYTNELRFSFQASTRGTPPIIVRFV